MRQTKLVSLAALALAALPAFAAPVVEGDALLKDFVFASGERLAEVRIHYRTLGALRRDAAGRASNAVLILHGTGGQGGNFVAPGPGGELFAGQLFGPGQPLDTERYFLVIPDNLGHGRSSKPSDGLRAKFPAYRYQDLVLAQFRLLTETLGVDHLRLVMGTSMGGMHTWLWGERYPDFMDALMPLASLPAEIAGRNRMWRRMVAEAIRQDPEWQGGNYERQPRGLRWAVQMLLLMSSNPAIRQHQAPTGAAADQYLEEQTSARFAASDANDLLYAVESSGDYDPAPDLGNIKAPLVAINSADDLINPPELGLLEAGIAKVPAGRAIVLPFGPETVGHSSHTKAVLWRDHLAKLLKETEPAAR